MAKRGSSARAKGHDFERWICKLLKERGFFAVTSRSESKRLDDRGADLVSDFPFHIQAKATEQAIPYHKLLKEMKKELTDKPPATFHKRSHQGVVVSLALEDFLNLIHNEKQT